MKLDALFFGAHPDDVELSCGGTVIKLVKKRKKVGIIDLTQGELGTRGTVKSRSQETRKASGVMGIQFRGNMGMPDGNIEENSENRLRVIEAIRLHKPSVVFAPYPSDRHPDHIHTGNLIKESAYYSGLRKIVTKKNGRTQTAHRPRKVLYYMQAYIFQPSFIIDISAEFMKKMEAIRCYTSQFYNPNSREPRTFISEKEFMDYLEARAKFYGFQIGVNYGEPYFSERDVEMTISNLFDSP